MSRPPTQNPFSSSSMHTGGGGSSNANHRSGNAGEWGRSTNGSNGFGHNFRNNMPTPTRSTGAYVPPHASQSSRLQPRDENSQGRTYTLEEMMQLRQEMPKQASRPELRDIFNMGHVPGQNTASSSNWGRRDENKEQNGVDICFNTERNTKPKLLNPMTEEEQEMFSSSVNSTAHKNRHDYKEGASYNRNKMSRTQTGETPTTPSFASKFRRRNTGEEGQTDILSSASKGDTKERSTPSVGASRLLSKWTTDEVASPLAETAPTEIFGKFSNHDGLPLGADSKPTQSPWVAGLRTVPRAPETPLSKLSLDDISVQSPQQTSQRPPWNSGRSESRFKTLMSQASIDDIQSPRRQPSNLDILNEGSSFDNSHGHAQKPGFFDEPGLIDGGRFGNAANHLERQGHESLRQLPGSIGWHQGPQDMANQSLHRRDTNEHYATPPHRWHNDRGGEPMSPSTTNPYQGSETDLSRMRDRDGSNQRQNGAGIESQYYSSRNSAAQQGYPVPSRSQTSSTGPPRPGMPPNGFDNGFAMREPGLSHSPWHMPPSSNRDPFAMPTLDRHFAPFGDAHGFQAGPNSFRDGNAAFGPGDRANRLEEIFNDRQHEAYQPHASPFPRTVLPDQQFSGNRPAPYSPAHAFARMEPNLSARASPAQGFRQHQQIQGSPHSSNALQASPVMNGGSLSHAQGSDPSETQHALPPNQRKNLLMPDKTAWKYKSKDGEHGPYSGLEMHEWYVTGHFKPDLLVRVDESSDYISLGSYIGRIGNDKEPFLVPVVGVSSEPTGEPVSSPQDASGVIRPPLVGSFPVFGTTLSATKQNQLEEEKQAATLLMARQRSDLNYQMSQRGLGKFAPGNQFGSPHHGPGYGPSSGPLYQPHTRNNFPYDHQYQQPVPGPGPIGTPRLSMAIEPLHRPDLESLSAVERDLVLEEEAKELQRQRSNEQGEHRRQASLGGHHDDPSRLQDFINLRAGEVQVSPPRGETVPTRNRTSITGPEIEPSSHSHPVSTQRSSIDAASNDIQKLRLQTDTTEATLPDPTAQRARNAALEGLVSEARDQVSTPAIETPSSALAPWARDQSEGPKGPSLKEIQDAEARKAAKHQEILAAARRAALEQETLNAAQAAAASSPIVSLPTSAQWASTASPVVSAGPAWATSSSSASAAAIANNKNSIAAIQKEQENRKNKAAAALATASAALPAGSVAGKRYADLASKVSAANPALSAAAGWSTVGSNGKAKTPISIVPTRAVSSGVPTTPVSKPKVASSSTSSAGVANEQFQKWAKASLSRGLNPGIPVDGFIKDLLQFPQELDILSEAIYANSASLDGRRFAEEFIKRHKQADKGVGPESGASTSFMSGDSKTESTTNGNAGWNEVAKKKAAGATEKEDASAGAFKVIAKKKGKK